MQSKMLLGTLMGLLLAGTAMAGDDWLTDFEKAKQAAREQKRPILADFSGCEWCGWCIKLDKEVFLQDEFKDYARGNLVLFRACFPNENRPKTDLDIQNEKLMMQYGIMGFPTVLLLDADGKVLGRTGYRPGGAAAYIRHLREFLKK